MCTSESRCLVWISTVWNQHSLSTSHFYRAPINMTHCADVTNDKVKMSNSQCKHDTIYESLEKLYLWNSVAYIPPHAICNCNIQMHGRLFCRRCDMYHTSKRWLKNDVIGLHNESLNLTLRFMNFCTMECHLNATVSLYIADIMHWFGRKYDWYDV